MPLDRNNKPLQEGDEVILRARVLRVKGQEEYVNVELMPLNSGRRGGVDSFWANSGQVDKVEPPAEKPPLTVTDVTHLGGYPVDTPPDSDQP